MRIWRYSCSSQIVVTRFKGFRVNQRSQQGLGFPRSGCDASKVQVQLMHWESKMVACGIGGQQTFLERSRPECPELSESEAIRRAQGGDADAFERIYKQHCRRVYALCLRMAGNRSEAEDLTQDAFLMVLRKIRTFRGESAFSTWLHRITVNLVLMRFRKKSPLES